MKTPPVPKDKMRYPIWVHITIPLTKAEMVYHVGTKCRDYVRDCVCCRLWKSWEKTGKIRTLVERRAGVLDITEEKWDR